jgi:hypothetical protein
MRSIFCLIFYSGLSEKNMITEEKENEASNSSIPTPSLPNEDIYPITIELEDSESQKMLDNIKDDFLKVNMRYYSIEDFKNKKILLEFEEEFSQLIFRIDDVEPINEEIKQARTQLIKTIQGTIDVVRKITQRSQEKEINVINLGEFFPNSNLNEIKVESIEIEIKEEPMDYECFVESSENIETQDLQPYTSNVPHYQPVDVVAPSIADATVNTGEQQTMEQDYEGNQPALCKLPMHLVINNSSFLHLCLTTCTC